MFHVSKTKTDHSRIVWITVSGIGTGVAVFLATKWWKRRNRFIAPTNWRKVGEISELLIYPVKSIGPIKLEQMECTILGPKFGWLRDRTLMVTNLDGVFVTARQQPRMLLVKNS